MFDYPSVSAISQFITATTGATAAAAGAGMQQDADEHMLQQVKVCGGVRMQQDADEHMLQQVKVCGGVRM